MSQRIHSCINNTNLDTIQCDAYASRLVTKDKTRSMPTKSIHTKTMRENYTTSRAMTAQNVTVGHNFAARQVSQLSKPESVVRKELYTENADMVEVTVKTHKSKDRPREHMRGNRVKEPWGKILKSQVSNENLSSFTNFDPLRTVHFLAKELQCKLQQSLPDDSSVQQMVAEMHQALGRVPTEVAHTFGSAYGTSDRCDLRPTKLLSNSCKSTISGQYLIDNSCQTPRSLYVEPEKIQQHLEASSEKIEKACKQMELLCSKLKTEKGELEQLLITERECVQLLNKQIADDKIKFNSTVALVESLQSKNDDMEAEVRRLQVQIESQQGPSAQELRTLILELQKQKADADEDCMLLKQQLAMAHMETEKYEAILQARDNQVKEIRNEMSSLQDVVNEQLLELQNNPYSSDASSLTNFTGTKAASLQPANSYRENKVMPSINAIDSRGYNINVCNKLIHHALKDTGDTSATSEDFTRPYKLTKYSKRTPACINFKPVDAVNESTGHKLRSELDGRSSSMFGEKMAEIKKQALSFTGIK